MDQNMFISDEVTMPIERENIDDGSQFFFQPDLLYGAKPNDGMKDNNDENVGDEDTDMQA